ncbi:MAG: 3-isopropylmalate dehydratase large subunit [Spirochaetes bacterium]|nr:3-isopropylmalate dehydratase large subunit [Spirochaetota bacterium]
MKMTVTEKILAHAAGKSHVSPGDIVNVSPDIIMCNDATTHITIDIFEKKLKNRKVKNPSKNVWVIDHNFPVNDIKTAEAHKKMKIFADRHGIANFHNGDGVCHQILLERYANPGQIIIGADSHTCTIGAIGAFATGLGSTDITGAIATGETWFKVPETIKINMTGKLNKGVYHRDIILYIIGLTGADGANYKAMEFTGQAVREMTVPERAVLCNMAVEAGAKNGIVEADEMCRRYLSEQGRDADRSYFKSDEDACYEKIINVDLSRIKPGCAIPHNVDNYDELENIEKNRVKIHQGFIGACSNGRIENLREAAEVLMNRKVNQQVKLMISPASQSVYKQALNEGLMDIFISAGAVVLNPSCSACWGGCQGIMAENQVSISTATRNFRGRTGHPDSQIYLASAAAVAASCIEGFITDPVKYIR